MLIQLRRLFTLMETFDPVTGGDGAIALITFRWN